MKERDNAKRKGERGQRVVIGELAKIGIDVAIPLSDNLPWDLIVCYRGRLLRAQVKTSECEGQDSSGNRVFYLRSNNWYSKEIHHYSAEDCELMFLCDLNNVYVIGPDEFSARTSFAIRQVPPKNGQLKGTHLHEDYLLSALRLDKLLGIEENVAA